MIEGKFSEYLLYYIERHYQIDSDDSVWDTLDRIDRHSFIIAIEYSLEKIFSETNQEGS